MIVDYRACEVRSIPEAIDVRHMVFEFEPLTAVGADTRQRQKFIVPILRKPCAVDTKPNEPL